MTDKATETEHLQDFTFRRSHTHAGKEYVDGDKGKFTARIVEKLKARQADKPLPKESAG